MLHLDRYIGEVVDHVRYELGIGAHVKVTIVHGTGNISDRLLHGPIHAAVITASTRILQSQPTKTFGLTYWGKCGFSTQMQYCNE